MVDEVTVPYDVKLNNLKYLIIDGSYREAPIRETIRPSSTPGGSREFRDNDNPSWAMWGQSNWEGDGVEDWSGDGGFFKGYGLSFQDTGSLTNDSRFGAMYLETQADGWLMIPALSNTRLIFIGKSDGRVRYVDTLPTNAVTYGPLVNAGVAVTSWSYFRGVLYVACVNGDIRSSVDAGATWTYATNITPPTASSALILGSYLNKLYVTWGSVIKAWDGTALTNPGGSATDITLEGTPSCAALGAGVFFIMTKGNPSRMYMMQSTTLAEMAQWGDDFQPEDAIFSDTLYVVGGGPDASGGQYGQRWRYLNNGLELDYEVPKILGDGVDYKIRSIASTGQQLLQSYNKGFGVIIYDSTLDIYEDPILGNTIGAISSANAAGTGNVIGIYQWKGETFIGLAGTSAQGAGVYRTDAVNNWSNFQVTSSLFGSSSKKVNKMWGWCELTYAPLVAGQSVLIEYSKDAGKSWTVLGTAAYNAADPNKIKDTIYFPANYLAPYLQYRLTGTTNDKQLSILDISLSFIEVASNPKRVWSFTVELYGDANDPMLYRDDTEFERTSKQMKDELDGLWNQRFAFEDLFGKTWTVMMPSPHTRVDTVARSADDADPNSVTGLEAQYQVNLVQVI